MAINTEMNEMWKCSQKRETDPLSDNSSSKTHIETLPDEMLLLIASYLNHNDLLSFSQCNQRLYNICTDKSLWKNVEIIACNGESKDGHHHLIPFIDVTTKSITLNRGYNFDGTLDFCISDKFFISLSYTAPNLTVFRLENHYLFNSKNFLLYELPETLQELSLCGTQINTDSNMYEVLKSTARRLVNLKILNLSYCLWFCGKYLPVISEFKRLKHLEMVGCYQLYARLYFAELCSAGLPSELESIDLRRSYYYPLVVLISLSMSIKHVVLESDHRGLHVDDGIVKDLLDHPQIRGIKSHPLADDIESLVIRYSPFVTNRTLTYITKACKSLRYLDLTGCSCTAEKLIKFKRKRPAVTLIWGSFTVLENGFVHISQS